jgi:GNAT superfamily N-acetyltransferase
MSLVENRVAGIGRIGDAEWHTGRTPDIRCLGQQDEGELRRLLLGLEPRARCSRFGQAASDTYLATHAKCALANADWLLGAFIDERLRGVVEVYDGGAQGYAGAAFVVEQGWRRQGLGWALLQVAIQIVADSQTNTLRMIFSRHNWPMRKLAGKASGKLDLVLDEILVDVALGEIALQSRADTAAKPARRKQWSIRRKTMVDVLNHSHGRVGSRVGEIL